MQLSNKNIKHYCASGKFLSINPLKSLYCIFVCISNQENFFRGGGDIFISIHPHKSLDLRMVYVNFMVSH